MSEDNETAAAPEAPKRTKIARPKIKRVHTRGPQSEGAADSAAASDEASKKKPAAQKKATAGDGEKEMAPKAEGAAPKRKRKPASKAKKAAGTATSAKDGEKPKAADDGTSKKKARRRREKARKKEHAGENLSEDTQTQQSKVLPLPDPLPEIGGFAQFNLTPPVHAAVGSLGFTEPTPVQEQSIPQGIAGNDIMASAQTGTGKTVAFLLPIFDRMVTQHPEGDKGPFALILTPTRELATQITECAQAFAQYTGFKVLNVIGGVKYEKQIKGLEAGCDVLIATPGRLNDLFKQGALSLEHVSYLVLDEVDRMVDMGFWPSVHTICRNVKGPHQTFLFSATFTSTLEAKAKLLTKDPVRVEVSHKGETADAVEEFVCPVSFGQKQSLLVELIKEQGADRVLVFTPTKTDADICALILQKAGVNADSIHSDKPQGKRDGLLRDFRAGKIDVLVATDVLARGIDISDVSYVVNFTVPTQVEDYTHRIGRTGRAGETGRAYTFVSPDQLLPLREIEYFTSHLLENHDVEGFTYDDERLIPDPNRPTKRMTSRGGRRLGRRR